MSLFYFLQGRSLLLCRRYYSIQGLNILLLIIRILKRMHFQPRLGVVTRSLAIAGPDLMHFAIVAGVMFLSFAMMAHLMFNNATPLFETYEQSINTCFELLLGEVGAVQEDFAQLTGMRQFDFTPTLMLLWRTSNCCIVVVE